MVAGSNNFGNLVVALQANLNVELNQITGFLQNVTRDKDGAQRAAYGQLINYRQVPDLVMRTGVVADCCDRPCPEQTPWALKQMAINNSVAVDFCWTGEEELLINNTWGGGANAFRDTEAAEAIRKIRNAMEDSVAAVGYKAAQSYTPVNGGVLFNQQSDNIKDLTNLGKLLDRAGAGDNRALILGFDAYANLGNTYNLTRANENASDMVIRRGMLEDVYGFDIVKSAAADKNLNGGATGTGYLVNNGAGYPAGAKAIVVDTGTGTIPAGTKVTFAGVTGSYTVVSFAANTITLAQGLAGAVADNAAITIDADGYFAQLAFDRRAIVLLARAPAVPADGDLATQRAYITDPISGLTMMLSKYPGYRANNYELSIVWGVEMVKPELAVVIPA